VRLDSLLAISAELAANLHKELLLFECMTGSRGILSRAHRNECIPCKNRCRESMTSHKLCVYVGEGMTG
jgi:hypothetical protein